VTVGIRVEALDIGREEAQVVGLVDEEGGVRGAGKMKPLRFIHECFVVVILAHFCVNFQF
jgi:hypothetical protein